MGMTRSQQFIRENAHKLSAASDYFNVDSALMRRENYHGSKLKMLLILPTPALQKSVSATVSVINSSFYDTHEGCFLDIAYLPPKEDQKLFDDNNIPYCVGNVTHLDASYFDVIGFSISVLHEIMTIPTIIKSFERCDKPIPLTWTERKECKIGDQPFLIAGGITAVNSDICFGPLEDGTGRVGYLDGLILGQDDVLEDIFPIILDSREKGHTIGQCIERWHTNLHFYHPYSYEIKYRDNLIVKNVKINPKARDLVKPRYDKTIKKRLYSARTVVSGTGANAGATQVMLSEGCTGGNGNYRFCAEGHYTGSWVENPIENVKWAAREAKRYSAASSVKPISFNCNHYSDYSELLYELKREYPVVTFINMRLEELAQDTESWDMMSYLGASRLSAPVEGLSDRVRNNLMNKNLSLESVETLFDYMIGQGISDLKVGLVFTGYEEDRDWDEITEQMIRLKKKAELLGKKLPIRFKACLYEGNVTPIPGVGLVAQNKLTLGGVHGLEMDAITEIIPGHTQECFKVTLSDGSILIGNGDHPLLTNPINPSDGNNFTFFKDLSMNHQVFKKIGANAFNNEPAVLPDGAPIDANFILEMAKALKRLENGEAIFEPITYPEFEGAVHTRLRKLLSEGTSYRFPEVILTGSKDQQIGFIKAYLSFARLTNSPTGKTLYLSGTKETLNKIQLLLANVGVHSVVSPEWDDQFIVYSLKVDRSYLAVLESIGFTSEYLEELKKYEPALFVHHELPELITLTVDTVVPVGEMMVYGLTVNKGIYLTDFVVSHNTPLVQYPLTAFEYIERKATKLSYEGKRFISDERYQKNREAGIQVRFNGFPHSTFIEQALVDLGSSITWWLHKHLVMNMELAYDLRVVAATDERMQSFKELITNHEKFFGERDLDNYISPTHRIRLDVEGGTYVSARAILKGKDPEPTGKCLYTYNGCSTSCSFKDIRDNPFIRYSDCEIDENWKISGKIYNKIEGCQYCETPKERVDHHLKRKLSKKYTMKDITSEVYARNLTKYRIVIERQFMFKEVNPNNTAYTSIAAMLNAHEPLLEAYWEIDKHSFDHQTDPDIPFAASGIQVIDVLFKSNVDAELNEGIRKANIWLKASKIISWISIPLEEKMKLTHLNVFRFETSIPLEKVLAANKTYNKTVKVKKDMEVIVVEDKQLITPAVTSYGKTIGYFTLPVKYNPYLYLQTLLKDTRLSYSSLKAEIFVKSVLFTAESKSAVCSCGQPTLISLVNNKSLKCPTCLTKSLLIAEMNKAKQKQELTPAS